MSMFPGAGAVVYRNEEGEPLGWDYPSEPDPYDEQDRWYDEGPGEYCPRCGETVDWLESVKGDDGRWRSLCSDCAL